MPKYTVVHLENFKGGLHLARGLSNAYDSSLRVLHSDTLKSAIFVMALHLYPEIGDEADDYAAARSFLSGFKISSAFPFYGNKEDRFYFFPKPDLPDLTFSIDGDALGNKKQLKRIRYLQKELFEGVLAGDESAFRLETEDIKGSFAGKTGSKFAKVLAADGCEAISISEPRQQVRVPRMGQGGDSMPYYVDKIFFHQKAGLFFLLETSSDDILGKVKSAMRLLQDSGIGTDRNTGNGQFDVSFGTMELKAPEQGNYELNLSLYCPHREELAGMMSRSFYGLVKRGGYISSPESIEHISIRKRSIYMFTEGSVFPAMNEGERRTGKLVNLKPDYKLLEHPIWRDGRPLFVPLIYKNHEA